MVPLRSVTVPALLVPLPGNTRALPLFGDLDTGTVNLGSLCTAATLVFLLPMPWASRVSATRANSSRDPLCVTRRGLIASGTARRNLRRMKSSSTPSCEPILRSSRRKVLGLSYMRLFWFTSASKSSGGDLVRTSMSAFFKRS